MKMFNTNFAIVCMAFVFLASFETQAQTAPVPETPVSTPADLDVGTITSDADVVTTLDGAVMFYNPATNGPSLTLTASTTDTDGNTFTSYEWYLVTADGTETIIESQTSANLPLSELAPGYHKYRVYGLADTGGGSVTCQSDEYQDIILFVLSPLTIETTVNLNGNTQAYCVNNLPTTPINLSVSNITADYSTNTNGYANPDGNDFEVTYNWYAVEADQGTPIDLGTTTNNYDVTLTEPGTYTFYTEVEYVVKTDDGSRDYITYTGNVEDEAGNALEIVVTPVPGTPNITIGSVNE